MKKTYVLVGNFGSGKSEISLNIAMKANEAKHGSTVLIDLDIVNPYFRSAERKDMLGENGIKLIYPQYAMTGVEAMSIPPDIYSVFIDGHETVVFDVGGDNTGAIALGQYRRNFAELENLEILYAINCKRPFSAEAELNLEMMNKICAVSRLTVTGLINNTNLSNETTAETLYEGYEMVKTISELTGIPVRMTVGTEDVIKGFEALAREKGLEQKYIGELYPITRYMNRDWERFLQNGI